MFSPQPPKGESFGSIKKGFIYIKVIRAFYSKWLPLRAGLIGSKKVQSTIIFVANFIRIRSGAEHRNPIIFRCAAPCELYFYRCYKYFAALPLAKIRTNQPCPPGVGGKTSIKAQSQNRLITESPIT